MPRAVDILPVRLWDMPRITQMSFDNMLDVDRDFAATVSRPPLRWIRRLYIPLHLWTSGKGFKAVVGGELAGCAYLFVRRKSGYIFNVGVNTPFRRQGVGRDLMGHLESLIASRGRHWAALHVDAINHGARAFYEQLGYRSYRASFWHVAHGQPAQQPPSPEHDVRWHPLRHDVRTHLARLAATELREGDAWAADIVAAEYMGWRPGRQQAWRLTWRDEEVGVVRAEAGRESVTVHLLFHPEFWGHPLLAGVLGQLPARTGGRRFALHLGSSEHAAAAVPQLAGAGFERRPLRLLLLLKLLPSANG